MGCPEIFIFPSDCLLSLALSCYLSLSHSLARYLFHSCRWLELISSLLLAGGSNHGFPGNLLLPARLSPPQLAPRVPNARKQPLGLGRLCLAPVSLCMSKRQAISCSALRLLVDVWSSPSPGWEVMKKKKKRSSAPRIPHARKQPVRLGCGGPSRLPLCMRRR